MADGDVLANQLFTSLTANAGFVVPVFDFSGEEFEPPIVNTTPIPPPTNGDLTQGDVDGTGTFDELMKGVRAQLAGEFQANRITGAEYTKAYIALTQSAMAASVQYLLGRDQAYWQSVVAQIQASTARIGMETAKASAALVQAQIIETEAQYALTKMKLSTEETAYDMGVFQVSDLGPQQRDLVVEQRQAARAQTLDERSDGAAVSGSIGKQKALYDQQITSYKRDAETKLAKIFSDAWVTQKTLDEGLLPPNSFTNQEIDEVMTILRANLNLGS
jgi:hypothetical protein